MMEKREFQPRWYQTEISDKAVEILNKEKIVYLACEVRTGKTFMALMTAKKYGAERVLFLTVKKAIGGIKEDVDTFGQLQVDVISRDSAHKVNHKDYDLVVVDEAHGCGAFPKPSSRYKNIKKVVKEKPLILMSGTPTPESYAQLYHQLTLSYNSCWTHHGNFYRWAKAKANIKQKKYAHGVVNDYSDVPKANVQDVLDRYFIDFSQEEADFKCAVKEHTIELEMKPSTMNLMQKLKKDKVYQNNGNVVLGDTPVKLLSKCHQICSGTVLTEDGEAIIFDTTKAEYIKERFKGKRMAIYYKYQAELQMLKDTFGDNLTTDIVEFNSTDKHIACQIKSGSMGINLSAADVQVFMNLDFSSQDYIQSRARLQTQSRESVDVYFIFSKGGVEKSIYKVLQKKQDYTAAYYKKYFKQNRAA